MSNRIKRKVLNYMQAAEKRIKKEVTVRNFIDETSGAFGEIGNQSSDFVINLEKEIHKENHTEPYLEETSAQFINKLFLSEPVDSHSSRSADPLEQISNFPSSDPTNVSINLDVHPHYEDDFLFPNTSIEANVIQVDYNEYDELPTTIESDSENDYEVSPYTANDNFEAPAEDLTISQKISICLAESSSGMTHTAINKFLNTLRREFPADFSDLPKDARTVLKTPSFVNIESMGDGKFSYLGISKRLIEYLMEENGGNQRPDTLELTFNVDGLPLFKSSKIQAWPILCQVVDHKLGPFLVAVFCGFKKPPLKKFMRKFVDELKD